MTDSNATNERTISVDLPDYPAAVVEFYLVSSIAISGAEVFPTKLYSLTLDANGQGTIELPTPDGDGTLAWLWHIKLPDGTWATNVTLAWGAGTLALSTWLAAAASTATPSDLLGQYVHLAGDTMTGLLTLSGAPTASLHAATKAYADSVAGATPDVGGITTDTGNATEMLRVDGAGTGLEFQTESQVLANIGAAASGHDHDADYDALGAAAAAASDLTTHEADTTTVHGIADTSALLDSGDIGSTVQGFDADTAKLDVAQTWSADQNLADQLVTRAKLKDTGEAVQALGSLSGTLTVDYEDGQYVTATLSGNVTTLAINNWPASGTHGAFTLELTPAGNTVTWTGVTWVGDEPTLGSTVDIIVLWTRDGGTTIYAAHVGATA